MSKKKIDRVVFEKKICTFKNFRGGTIFLEYGPAKFNYKWKVVALKLPLSKSFFFIYSIEPFLEEISRFFFKF